MIKFDLHGRELALDEAVVQKLQAEALARAGSSTTLNDLAVILTRGAFRAENNHTSKSRVARAGTAPSQIDNRSRNSSCICARIRAAAGHAYAGGQACPDSSTASNRQPSAALANNATPPPE